MRAGGSSLLTCFNCQRTSDQVHVERRMWMTGQTTTTGMATSTGPKTVTKQELVPICDVCWDEFQDGIREAQARRAAAQAQRSRRAFLGTSLVLLAILGIAAAAVLGSHSSAPAASNIVAPATPDPSTNQATSNAETITAAAAETGGASEDPPSASTEPAAGVPAVATDSNSGPTPESSPELKEAIIRSLDSRVPTQWRSSDLSGGVSVSEAADGDNGQECRSYRYTARSPDQPGTVVRDGKACAGEDGQWGFSPPPS